MRSLVLVLFLLWSVPVWGGWHSLEKGFEYQSLDEEEIHLLRIDPDRFQFDLLTAQDYQQSSLTASDYAQKSGALVVINGGFFDPSYRSLGLLVRRGKIINPIRRNNWGIFQIKKGNQPSIIHQKSWDPTDVILALEVGPRLVIDGKIPKFRESGSDRRSAIGVSRDGNIVIALSENLLTLSEWASLLKPYCVDALNLDGGGSTQMVLRHPKKEMSVEGWTPVSNVLIVQRSELPN